MKDLIGGRGVKVAGRLIGQKKARPVGQRPAEGDALLFTPRQRGGAMIGPCGDADLPQQFARPRLGLGPPDTRRELRQHDIFQCREFRQEVVELIDEPDLGPPERRAVAIGQSGRLTPGNQDLPRIRAVKKPRDMQKRGLPRTRWRHEAYDLPRCQHKVKRVQHPHLARLALQIDLRDPAQFQHRLTHSAAPRPGSSAPRGGRERW